MTAKEKAQQLVQKFRTGTSMILMTEMAKPLALIAVKEIMKAKPMSGKKQPEDVNLWDSPIDNIDYQLDYWQEVHEEIVKL